MFSKSFRKNYVYIIISLSVVIVLTVYMMMLQKHSRVQLYNKYQTQLVETFYDVTSEKNAFDIPTIKKWQLPYSINRWYHITQGGYEINFRELGFTMPNSKMSIMFLFNCQNRVGFWRNIFHFTNTGKNCCDKGDRIPAMWVYPDYTSNFHIRFSTDKDGNDGSDVINEEEVYIPHLLTLVFDDNMFYFYANDKQVLNTGPHNNIYKRDDKTVLKIGDPWHWNTGLHIKNFTLYDGVLSETQVRQVYKTLTERTGELTF